MTKQFDFLTKEENEEFFRVKNSVNLDVRLFANENVPVERESFDQLFDFLDVERAIDDIRTLDRTADKPFFGDNSVGLDRVVLTPDFHKGSLIPVGVAFNTHHCVIPQAIGNDVCCGMRLLITDLPAEALEPHWAEIQKRLRAIFFEGERNIPMSPRQREAVLRDGLVGLVETSTDNESNGIWSRFDRESARDDLAKAHSQGQFQTRGLFGFDKFVESSGKVDGRDPQIGCVGGGNHFCEIQRVDALFDGHLAREWGLVKGNVAIMIHSGSVGLGHAIGGYFMDRARTMFPTSVRAPKSGFHPLPTTGQHTKEGQFYLDGMGNAANFAFANRLFLGLMAVRAIEEACGKTVSSKLVYDAPHNLVFPAGENKFLHRKGATPAEGPLSDGWIGSPVIIPGSMGASSYLLAGQGCEAALESACHGAGRAISRGKAAHVKQEVYHEATSKLRIVGPIDPKSPQLSLRKDILEKYTKRMMEEAPYAYKPVEPVIDSVESAGVARKVARLFPLCTVKG